MQSLDFKNAATLSEKRLFEVLETGKSGISEESVAQRRAEYGTNTFSSYEVRWREIVMRQLASPFLYLLVIAGIISWSLGERIDAGIIALFVVLNAGLGVAQEFKAAYSLRAFKEMLDERAVVVREGETVVISVKDLVVGDVVHLKAGDTIPADGRVIEARGMTVDEAILTGESDRVEKSERTLRATPSDIYHAKNTVFAKTLCASGEGVMVVTAVGKHTEAGTVSGIAHELHGQSVFEKGIAQFSSFIVKLVLATIPVIFLANILLRGESANIGELVVFVIALMVGVVPEALPLVTTISMTQGALHLAKKKVVPTRLSAIEDLGSIEVLCTDKTDTLTERRLEVDGVFGDEHDVLAYTSLASWRHPGEEVSAFDESLTEALRDRKVSVPIIKKIAGIPFDPIRRSEAVIVEDAQGKKIVLLRGAPEHLMMHVSRPQQDAMRTWIAAQGREGKRVLAVGMAQISRYDAKKECVDIVDEVKIKMIGMVSFHNALKASSTRAVKEAKKLGVRVVMLTGDSKEVAGWVARKVGIMGVRDEVVTGADFAAMSPEEKYEVVGRVRVFARVAPMQKHEIVELLKRDYFVGFLGEGFNDAPALKSAHVGLVVENGSGIAREAADIVLLNKSLAVIVDGIKEGRSIFANTVKYIRLTLTSNFGNFYALAFASVLIPFLPMLPVQILLLNLLSDVPMMAIATDSVDAEEVRTPRSYHTRQVVAVSIILGLVSTCFDFAFFGIFVGGGATQLHTTWFVGSVLAELILIFSLRTVHPFWKTVRPERVVMWSAVAAAGAAIILPYTYLGRHFFSFAPLTFMQLMIIAGLVVGYFVVNEIVKYAWYRYEAGLLDSPHIARRRA